MGDVKEEIEEGHLGKIILNSLKNYENETNQIEIVTGATETHGSVRLRTIRMAEALKAKGIKLGDVIMIAGVNHNDLCIPFLAALCIGAVPMGLTIDMKHLEIKHFLSLGRPKMIFADPVVVPAIQKALNEIKSSAYIVIFGDDKIDECDIFSNFVKQTGKEEIFKCEVFDPKKTMAILACSSGSTGLPKLVALSHYSLYFPLIKHGAIMTEDLRKVTSLLTFSPIYWISGAINILSSCCAGHTKVHSIRPYSPEDFQMASKVYKPTITLTNQVALCSLMEYSKKNTVDLSNFRAIFYGGSSVSVDILQKLKKLVPNVITSPSYGCTEVSFVTSGLLSKTIGSCGKPLPFITWKIVDVETEKELGPNLPGELRLKAPHTFMCYYNNPEATANAFDKDGWYKTGDLMYYNEDNEFFVVDRIKELIKFRNYQISSAELEHIIINIPGVVIAAVVGVPNYEDGEHPMAFVQLEKGLNLSAQQIKDYVKENMSDSKQLRAGVVFVDDLPKTYNGKLDRKKLREMKSLYKGE